MGGKIDWEEERKGWEDGIDQKRRGGKMRGEGREDRKNDWRERNRRRTEEEYSIRYNNSNV